MLIVWMLMVWVDLDRFFFRFNTPKISSELVSELRSSSTLKSMDGTFIAFIVSLDSLSFFTLYLFSAFRALLLSSSLLSTVKANSSFSNCFSLSRAVL